jgi:hypothetical protein
MVFFAGDDGDEDESIRPLLDTLNQYYSMAEIDVMFEKVFGDPLGFMRVALSRIVL